MLTDIPTRHMLNGSIKITPVADAEIRIAAVRESSSAVAIRLSVADAVGLVGDIQLAIDLARRGVEEL